MRLADFCERRDSTALGKTRGLNIERRDNGEREHGAQ
jgi:hypothetical protein